MEAVIVRDNGRIYKLDQGGYEVKSEVCDLEGNLISEHEMSNEEALVHIEKLYDIIDVLTGIKPSDTKYDSKQAYRMMIQARLNNKMLSALQYSLDTLENLGKLKTFKSRWPEINMCASACNDAVEEANEFLNSL